MEREQIFIIGGILGSLVLIVGGAILVNQFRFGGDPAKLLTHGKAVHWHAEITASVCGVEQKMPIAEKGGILGFGAVHTHDDGLAHMEGTFGNSSDIFVQKYLTSVGVPYSSKGIFGKVDGTPCAPTDATSSAKPPHFYGTINGVAFENILSAPMHKITEKDDQIDKIRMIYE